MKENRVFTMEELELAKKLAYENMESEEMNIGFAFKDSWVTNPFVEVSGRFEFTDFDAMCKYYGKENVVSFINKLLESQNMPEVDYDKNGNARNRKR